MDTQGYGTCDSSHKEIRRSGRHIEPGIGCALTRLHAYAREWRSGDGFEIAYYHVRFENIHPLHDGNGRVGRTIMTGQMLQSCQISPAMFEWQLTARNVEYRLAFDEPTPPETYAKLVQVLSHATQIRVGDTSLAPEFSLEPIHRSPGSPDASGVKAKHAYATK